ncbi:stage II sporulation protein P [Ureibacillus chungkukjangi]|uniref:Stage II sporulation protein P n=1 Tax=Ureibacillus chungkukjangi TaxID=1202712 RepID=A0A318TJX4_9BACL|nr:stage II sporulation protein P [Ureibacillus chungkukjangi]MCM3387888.1 stage II sporulation protein P [Ureibacillus chungkukjangi]PYF03448.1 stage II sporulation protein P [Ureibacillus chungkukjangi]
MSTKLKQNKKASAKKRTILVLLLYFALLLFFLWLLGFLWLMFFNESNKNENSETLDETNLPEKSNSSEGSNYFKKPNNPFGQNTEIEIDNNLGSPERDEYQPSMKTLFENRELKFENIDVIFENMKSSKRPEMQATFGKDVVYIYHTHSRESFLPYLKNTFKPEEAYHSIANITLVGKMLGRALESYGVGTKVDTSDIVQLLETKNLIYGNSYDLSGEIVKAAQSESGDLDYFIDVHRDSLRKRDTSIEINGLKYARLLFVVGTGHADYEKNLAFANELQTMLDTLYPGLSKGILQKSSSQGNGIYNQDLSPNSIILEIGGVDNTVEELHRSTEAFAEVVSEFYWRGEE